MPCDKDDREFAAPAVALARGVEPRAHVRVVRAAQRIGPMRDHSPTCGLAGYVEGRTGKVDDHVRRCPRPVCLYDGHHQRSPGRTDGGEAAEKMHTAGCR